MASMRKVKSPSESIWKVLVNLLGVIPHEAAKGVLSVTALEVLRIVLPVLVRFHIYGK